MTFSFFEHAVCYKCNGNRMGNGGRKIWPFRNFRLLLNAAEDDNAKKKRNSMCLD